MIEYLFLDLDDTILDFQMAERVAIPITFRAFGMEPTEEVVALYKSINRRQWQLMEEGKLNRDEVVIRRFVLLFEALGIQGDPEKCAFAYMDNLCLDHYYLPGAQEAIKRLSKKYRLFIATNGTTAVQQRRMESAGLYPYFERVFISGQIGADKPSMEFFERSFAQIPDFDKSKAMIVGDSLTSDIRGGQQAGIATCWVNPNHKEGAIRPDYEIESITQLEDLLEKL